MGTKELFPPVQTAIGPTLLLDMRKICSQHSPGVMGMKLLLSSFPGLSLDLVFMISTVSGSDLRSSQ